MQQLEPSPSGCHGEEVARALQRLASKEGAAIDQQTNSAGEDFKCNICLNIASDAVVTLCGHLFCWPCLYTWLHFHSRYKECPVCKGAASETKLIPIYSRGGNPAQDAAQRGERIPPRPPARRVESERQRRQRYNAEREQRRRSESSTGGGGDTEMQEVTQEMSGRMDMIGRETRASWLERLRAMREERLAWPVAFVQGLTSREFLHQRQQARESMSPRFIVGDHHARSNDSNENSSYGGDQPGIHFDRFPQADFQRRSLNFLGSSDHMNAMGSSSNHSSQYLSTMSSILSSMEVFAKALQLSSSSLRSRSTTIPAHLNCLLRTPVHEQALWQSSMRSLLTQMERIMQQLQSIQRDPNSQTVNNDHPMMMDPAAANNWRSPNHGQAGSVTERNRIPRLQLERRQLYDNLHQQGSSVGISPRVGGYESNMNLARVPIVAQSNRSGYPQTEMMRENQGSAGSRCRKRWEVTRMSR